MESGTIVGVFAVVQVRARGVGSRGFEIFIRGRVNSTCSWIECGVVSEEKDDF